MTKTLMPLACLLALCAPLCAQQDDDGSDGPPEMISRQPQPPGEQRDMRPGGPGMMGGMRGPGMGGPREPQRPAELTEAQEKELLGFLKVNVPQTAEHLERAKTEAPATYHRKLAAMWDMYKQPDARERFVRTTKAERETRELVERYRKAAAGEKAAIKEKLDKAVGEQFDADVAGKEAQVKIMEREIVTLKEKIAKRREQKDKYVAKRVERLTGVGDDWEW